MSIKLLSPIPFKIIKAKGGFVQPLHFELNNSLLWHLFIYLFIIFILDVISEDYSMCLDPQ